MSTSSIYSNALQSIDVTLGMISTAIVSYSKMQGSSPSQEKAVKFINMFKVIVAAKNDDDLCRVLNAQLIEVSALAWSAQPSTEKEQLSNIAVKIKTTLEMIKGDSNPYLPAKAEKKIQPVALRIEAHNQRAIAAQKLLETEREEFDHYPLKEEEKQKFKANRTSVATMKDFIANKDLSKPAQILSETIPMHTCSVEVACTIGQRATMEDRYIAVPFKFTANGITYPAEIFGVLDGHGGPETTEVVSDMIAWRMKEELEARLENKNVDEDAVFYSLKETISSLHEDAIRQKSTGGTTAVIGFKVANSDELYVANIGDSRAYLNRNGKPIPMSIDQKPLLQKSSDSLIPNEYANQLFNKGIEISQDPKEDAENISNGKKMVLSFAYEADNHYGMRLGIFEKLHYDMARSIGAPLDQWKKHTPEIFKQIVVKGDQLILQTDGIPADMSAVAEIVQKDKENGVSPQETAACLVQASIPAGDNTTAMIISFDKRMTAK